LSHKAGGVAFVPGFSLRELLRSTCGGAVLRSKVTDLSPLAALLLYDNFYYSHSLHFPKHGGTAKSFAALAARG